MAKVAQILVAAGQGTRATSLDQGHIPKQYAQIAGKSLLRHSLDALRTSDPDIQLIVYAKGHEAWLEAVLDGDTFPVLTVEGGSTRTESVRAGLNALSAHRPDTVYIHDAARPFVSKTCLDALSVALQTAQAVAPILPLVDAVKVFENNVLGADIKRGSLCRIQTPQGFQYQAITQAFAALPDSAALPDDIAVAHAAKLSLATIDGDEANFKVTYPSDFAKAEHMFSRQTTYTATGNGYDVHRYSHTRGGGHTRGERHTRGDGLWLCGVNIPADYTLLGHSDADAGLHALTDAVLGALAEGDIGDHFPPSDPQWKDAASDKFLAFAVERARARGGHIEHVDITLICEKPKVKPYREAMRRRIAEIIGLPVERVSVKATTTERLGFTGREEGLAAQATATLTLPR